MIRENYRPSGSWSDLVVEVANIVIATVFLYRRVRDLWHWRRTGSELHREREGDLRQAGERR
jgi:hypothetical protein